MISLVQTLVHRCYTGDIVRLEGNYGSYHSPQLIEGCGSY